MASKATHRLPESLLFPARSTECLPWCYRKRCAPNRDEWLPTLPPTQNCEKEDLSAALLQDLTTQRTAALRAALSARPDIALIAITHNLAAQIFYDQTYLLPSSLTVRTDAHSDGFDLRAAAESEAAKTITKQTKDVRNLLPPKLELLWNLALEQPQDVLLKVLAVALLIPSTLSRARTTTLLPAD